MSSYIASGKVKEVQDFLPKFHSQLMKIAKTGVIRKETVSRKISRIAKKIKNLKKIKLINQRLIKYLFLLFLGRTK